MRTAGGGRSLLDRPPPLRSPPDRRGRQAAHFALNVFFSVLAVNELVLAIEAVTWYDPFLVGL